MLMLEEASQYGHRDRTAVITQSVLMGTHKRLVIFLKHICCLLHIHYHPHVTMFTRMSPCSPTCNHVHRCPTLPADQPCNLIKIMLYLLQ